jgi:hypothetical protein
MKKVLSIVAIAMLLIATSCSKEAKLNRKLDGEWNVVSLDGESMVASEGTLTFKFEKDKKGNGIVTLTESDIYQGTTTSDTYSGTYTLTKDDIITMTLVEGTTSDVYSVIVSSYDKSNMTFILDGDVFVLKKK